MLDPSQPDLSLGDVTELSGEFSSLGNHEPVVHSEEGLLGNQGLGTLRRALQGGREIEGGEEIVEVDPVDVGVHGAAVRVRGCGDFHGPASHGEVEVSRGGEDGVTHRLEIEPAQFAAPIQLVFGIFFGGFRAELAGLAIGLRKDDLANQLLGGPPVLDEVRGEVVEKFRVGRRIALQSHVAGCGNQRAAHQISPDPVGGRARRERIVGAGDRLGQFFPAGLFFGKGFAAQSGQKPARHGIAAIGTVAPVVDSRVPQVRFLDHHGAGRRGGMLRIEIADRVVQVGNFPAALSGNGRRGHGFPGG